MPEGGVDNGSDAEVRFWTAVRPWTCLNQTQVQAKVQGISCQTEPEVQVKVRRKDDGPEPVRTEPFWAADAELENHYWIYLEVE